MTIEEKTKKLAEALNINDFEIESPKNTVGNFRTSEGTYLVLDKEEADTALLRHLIWQLDIFDYDFSQIFSTQFIEKWIIPNCFYTSALSKWVKNDLTELVYYGEAKDVIRIACKYKIIKKDTKIKDLEKTANELRPLLFPYIFDKLHSTKDFIDYILKNYGYGGLGMVVVCDEKSFNSNNLLKGCVALGGYKPLACHNGEILTLDKDLYAIMQSSCDERFITTIAAI